MIDQDENAAQGGGEKSGGGLDSNQLRTLSELKAIRSSTKGNITRLKKLISGKGSSMSSVELECRLGIIESYFKQGLNVQLSLEKINMAEEEKANHRAELEDAYVSTKSMIQSMLLEQRGNTIVGDGFNSSFISQQPISRSKLERITLPTFSGKFSEFPNFIGIFSNLVDKDESLEALQKFNYLRKCLSGAALNAIKEFDLTPLNYRKALDRLKKRFDSKTLMFQEHLNGLMNINKISKSSAVNLRNLEDSFNSHIAAMFSIGSHENICDAFFISLALDKVDADTRAKWDESFDHSILPKWEDFSKVLDRRCQTLEAKESKLFKNEANTNPPPNRSRFRNNNRQPQSHNTLVAQSVSCEFCSAKTHDISTCENFNQLSVIRRFQEAKQRVLCINCLAKGHSVRRCQAPKCRVCAMPHHHLLHRFTTNQPTNTGSVSADSLQPSTFGSTHLVSSMFKKNCPEVILATALVYMRNSFGQLYPVRALLDSASQLNFITEDMVQKLRLKKSQTHSIVSGIGKSNAAINYKVEASCRSRISDFEINLDLLILKSITNILPANELDISQWKIPKNVLLADPDFYRPNHIDLLIGADSFFQLLCVGQITLNPQLPILQKTLFGWVVSGKYEISSNPQVASTLVTCSESEDACLSEIVKRFWEMEEVNRKQPFSSKEEEECEMEFLKGVRRQEDGRFLVNLLFKPNGGQLGDSLGQAQRRFISLEKRLRRNKEVRAQYVEFMTEYESLGHMEEVPRNQIDQIKYFAPHQFVLRPDSLSTKLRVVFDCSAKTTSNLSLNDLLLKGPVIQDDLYDIILRFRTYKFVVTADISKMYRQILVHDEDRNHQCILWRASDRDELKAFRLRTVTYGTISAPFIATRCLKLLADQNVSTYPLGAKVINEDFYMDDMITGGDSLEIITKIYSEVRTILLSAGFDLRKWCCNSAEIMGRISHQEKEKDSSLRINDKDVIKTLGIVWNPTTDEFQYIKPKESDSKTITKRLILSELSQIFDPLGLINPIVVKGKIVMQDIWIIKSSWDESLPMEIQTRWEEFRKEISTVDQIKLPRYISFSNVEDIKVEIHGFSDASIRAYGCCLYLRTTDTFGNIKCNLLSAKSKVAPIKTKSLPKLELCAATLLVELTLKVLPNLNYLIENIYLWTDSEIVLRWISAYPSSWEIFVANRVSKIQSSLPSAIWRYVNTKTNPADIVSRGAYGTELINSSWFSGPQFLYQTIENWPKQKPLISLVANENNHSVTLLTKAGEIVEFAENFVRFNDFQKTNRIFGYVLRFYNNLKSKVSTLSNPRCTSTTLIPEELEIAFLRIIWTIQQIHFLEEIKDLSKTKKISIKSVISNLNPFLDTEHEIELLRVGGRLQNADIPYNSKCPILLPKNSLFVKNVVVHLHKTNFHAGPQALVAIIRQRFWIVNARHLAKKVVDGCLHCFKYRPKLMHQIMGDLPASRVTISRPFAISGVDFCGPFHISQKRRGYCTHKAYIAVFICFATKASHLEVVSDLSTQGFIAALKRFVARRGLCNEIHCDNGTNFVGARNELKELRRLFLEQQTQDEIQSWCAAKRIQFIHIPPRTPHFGGLWEAAVKSAKSHLYRTVKLAYLTYEEFSTVVAEIESIMNSRPLCVLSPDPNDERVLTPGHFLIGVPLNSIPEPAVQKDVPLLDRWRRLTQIKQHFWARWSKEYVLELQRRAKWQNSVENISVGTLVLVADDNLPPQQWLLGRIERVIPDADSKIRVADIRVKRTILRRPIHRLAPLPIH